jgi:hypothetical protein
MGIDWSLIAAGGIAALWAATRFGPALWAKIKPGPKPKVGPDVHEVADAYMVLLAALQAEGEKAAAETLHEKILPAALPGPSSFEVDE